MRPSDMSSRVRRPLRVAFLVASLAALPCPASATVHMTQEEALETAFPGQVAAHRTAFLTEAEAAAVASDCGSDLPARIVNWYEAGGRTAWFDTHLVRTLAETIMIVVGQDGRVERIDILSFDEPDEYRPPQAFLAQLKGRRLDDELSLRRGVRPITGASLSGRAVVDATRRVLALHRRLVLAPAQKKDGTPEGGKEKKP